MQGRSAFGKIRHALSGLARDQPQFLLWSALLFGGTWGFVEVADQVIEGEAHRFDEYILMALRNPADHTDPVGPAWLEEMMRDFTALGSTGVLTLVCAGALGYLLLSGRLRTAVFTLTAVAGGLLLGTLLKLGFDRPRPELAPGELLVYTASFPSGHSMMSAVTYLTLAALLARIPQKPRLKAYLLCIAMVFTLLIGLSRVYLGVHWPTDVLAGWSVGAAWAALCRLSAGWMERRGMVNASNPDRPGTA